MKRLVFIAFALATTALSAEEQPFAGGLSATLLPDGITVSGISSGGYAAQQLHLAFAERIDGVGVLAAGPWGCARGNVMLALGACMAAEAPPAIAPLEDDLAAAEAAQQVAGAEHRVGDRAWFFHGSEDTTVSATVAAAGVAFYRGLLGEAAVAVVNEVPATHTFPTPENGPACDVAEAPFVAACGYDAVGAMLTHLLEAPAEPMSIEDPVLETLAVPDAADASLLDEAYVHVPEVCRDEAGRCQVHVVLHGCAMSSEAVGTGFIRGAGYLEHAAARRLVLLFPQVRSSGTNPYGCWDWWGYGGTDYQTRTGAQLETIMALVDALDD